MQRIEVLTKIFEYDLSELQKERAKLERKAKSIERIKMSGSSKEKRLLKAMVDNFEADKAMLGFDLKKVAMDFTNKHTAIYGSPQSPLSDVKTSISSIITLDSFFLDEVLKNAFDIRATKCCIFKKVDDDRVQFIIVDNGPGFPESMLGNYHQVAAPHSPEGDPLPEVKEGLVSQKGKEKAKGEILLGGAGKGLVFLYAAGYPLHMKMEMCNQGTISSKLSSSEISVIKDLFPNKKIGAIICLSSPRIELTDQYVATAARGKLNQYAKNFLIAHKKINLDLSKSSLYARRQGHMDSPEKKGVTVKDLNKDDFASGPQKASRRRLDMALFAEEAPAEHPRLQIEGLTPPAIVESQENKKGGMGKGLNKEGLASESQIVSRRRLDMALFAQEAPAEHPRLQIEGLTPPAIVESQENKKGGMGKGLNKEGLASESQIVSRRRLDMMLFAPDTPTPIESPNVQMSVPLLTHKKVA